MVKDKKVNIAVTQALWQFQSFCFQRRSWMFICCNWSNLQNIYDYGQLSDNQNKDLGQELKSSHNA